MGMSGMSSQGAFSASSGGNDGNGQARGEDGTGTSGSATVAAASVSYSASSYSQSVTSQNNAPASLSPSSVNVGFNDNATRFSPEQARSETLRDTSHELIAVRNEREQALHVHAENWKVARDKLAAKALPMPTFELDHRANRNINREYSDLLWAHQAREQQITARFDHQRDMFRNAGITLQASFTPIARAETGPAPAKAAPEPERAQGISVSRYQRREINYQFKSRSRDVGRER